MSEVERGIRRKDTQKKSDSHRWNWELLEVNQERRGRYLKGQIFVCRERNVLLPSRTHAFLFFFFFLSAEREKRNHDVDFRGLTTPTWSPIFNFFQISTWPPCTSTVTRSEKQARANWSGRNKWRRVKKTLNRSTLCAAVPAKQSSLTNCARRPRSALLDRANRFDIHQYTWQHRELTWQTRLNPFLLKPLRLSLVRCYAFRWPCTGKCQHTAEGFDLLMINLRDFYHCHEQQQPQQPPLNYLYSSGEKNRPGFFFFNVCTRSE